MPGASRNPVPLKLALLLVANILENGNKQHIEAAMCAMLQLDTYCRPSEILNLAWQSVIVPTKHGHQWGLVIGDSALGHRTKT
eukprot:10508732-Karenia_brevis.AAC.1